MADEEKVNYSQAEFELSDSAKIEYLVKLIGKMCKIVHIAEEKEYSPVTFIWGTLFEVRAANSMFNNKLIDVLVKLKGIHDEYDILTFNEVRRQINEIKRIINSLLTELGYEKHGRN